MKILLINVVYGKGSTGFITESLFEAYKKLGHDVSVIYGRHSTVHNSTVFKCTSELESKIHHAWSKFSGNMYGGMCISTKNIIKKIKEINPDVVHLQCLNGYFVNIYKLLKFLGNGKIKVIMSMHADFMMTGGCGLAINCANYLKLQCKNCKFVKEFNSPFSLRRTHHFYKKLENSLLTFDSEKLIVTCVSPWLAKRYSKSPLYSRFKVCSVLNPIDNIFFSNPSVNHYSNKTNNILYVTSNIYDQDKSAHFIEPVAEKMPDCNFYILSSRNVNYETKCKNIQFIFGGNLKKEDLRDYYGFADASLIFSQRETYSMTVAESLACGTPVVGFKCGGPDSIGFSKSAIFVDYGNVDEMVKRIQEILSSHERVVLDKNLDNINIAKEFLELVK